jgi:tetratricopeptide (TPR) repeat protein
MHLELPEPFRSAIEHGTPAEVCDAEAVDPAERFARGVARMRVGRHEDARADFEHCLDSVQEPCRLQIALLDLRAGRDPAEVAEEVREILDRAEAGTLIRAEALHLLGVTEIRRRRSSDALDALLEAADTYRNLGRRDLIAQVQDSLGMEAAASGRLDHAVSWYALSLVGKTLSGDRYGTAITLGNLGRLHLREGRLNEALDCLQLDLEIARSMGDRRAESRLLNDIGRLRLEEDSLDEAAGLLTESLEIARNEGFHDLEFFNHKDLALVHLSKNRMTDVESELEAAESLVDKGVPAYRSALVTSIRGRSLLAIDDAKGLEFLERAADAFSELELPDDEIPERIRVARAYCDNGHPRTAEQHLTRALELARRDGYARYLPSIREAMGRLSLVESAVEETGRSIHVGRVRTSAPEGYVLFESLGAGGFGEVFRAFDSGKSQIVALKRLRLEELYDVHLRERLQATARLELEAASRVRHPGVARVHAVGNDEEGGTYIVQEFIDGISLREKMRNEPDLEISERLEILQLIGNALHALHAQNVVHRDLKPENILLRAADGNPVLVDFGIARIPDVDDVVGRETIVGTLGYMAPEQLRARPVDGGADVYSLGVIVFEWLTGSPPIRPAKQGFSDAIAEVLERRSAILERKAGDLPPDAAGLIARMLAVESRNRPSAESAAEALGRLARKQWEPQKTVIREPGVRRVSGASEDDIETEWFES